MTTTLPSSQTIEHSSRQSRSNVPFLIAHPIASSIVILIFGILNLMAQRLFDWQDFVVSFEVGLTIIGVCIPLIAAFLYRKFCSQLPVLEQMLDLSPELVTTWFGRQMDAISGNVVTYAAYALFAAAVDITIAIIRLPWSVGVAILFLVFFGVLMLGAATIGWIYVRSLVSLSRLSNLEVEGSRFDWPEKQFADLNRIYMEMFLVAVLFYSGFVISIAVIPGGELAPLNNPLTRLWIFPIAGTVVYYFLACQYYIHRLMTHSKQRRIGEMNRMVAGTLDNWLADQSTEKAKLVTELLNWNDRVHKDPDWPLDFKSTLIVISGLLLPAIKTILDLVSR